MNFSYETVNTIVSNILFTMLVTLAVIVKYVTIKDFYKIMDRSVGAKIFVGFNCLLDLSVIIMAIWAFRVADQSGPYSIPLLIFGVLMLIEGLSMGFMMIVKMVDSNNKKGE